LVAVYQRRLEQTYSLFEDASGETIVEDVPGASHAARKPNKPIKIAIFFISVQSL